MTLRPFDFSDGDYEAVADLWNRTYPEHPTLARELKDNDETRPDKIVWQRYVLEAGGEAAGFGVFLNSESTFHPHEFVLTLVVAPEHHGRGYGRALYAHLLRDLEPHRPTLLKSWSREDLPRKTRFLLERGFEEAMRSFESRLKVAAFDPSLYMGVTDRLAEGGFEIKSYAELSDDPERERKIYALHTTLDLDVPMVGSYTKPSFERFAAAHWEDERFLPEGYLLAVDGERYVGVSEVFRSPADERLHMGLTGVLREYRRRGVALALKLRSLEVARALGVGEISTWNASSNRPMLALNERLGFVKQPASIDFVKRLEP